jgi:hypothetical protein
MIRDGIAGNHVHISVSIGVASQSNSDGVLGPNLKRNYLERLRVTAFVTVCSFANGKCARKTRKPDCTHAIICSFLNVEKIPTQLSVIQRVQTGEICRAQHRGALFLGVPEVVKSFLNRQTRGRPLTCG